MTERAKASKSSATANRYVAFLRGINVGGKVIIKMDALRAVLAANGFANVKTVLASGNVLFDAKPAAPTKIAAHVASILAEKFGRKIGVVVRPLAEIQKLAVGNPFAGIEPKPQTRLHVTFLSEPRLGSLKTLYKSLTGDFVILRATADTVFSVLTLSERTGTTEAMKILESQFGREITTRNWNTIQKIVSA